jgi:phosphoribosylformylglycinamidine (FGAM) synthase PurS component
MANRNPLSFIEKKVRSQAIKLYWPGIETNKLSDLAFDAAWRELEDDVGPDQAFLMLRMAARAYARILVGKIGFSEKCEKGQIDFFRDHEIQFTLRRGKGASVQIALGDLTLDTIAEVREQKVANIEAAKKSLAEFDAACEAIVPILNANPGWKWRDAAELILKSRR